MEIDTEIHCRIPISETSERNTLRDRGFDRPAPEKKMHENGGAHSSDAAGFEGARIRLFSTLLKEGDNDRYWSINDTILNESDLKSINS